MPKGTSSWCAMPMTSSPALNTRPMPSGSKQNCGIGWHSLHLPVDAADLQSRSGSAMVRRPVAAARDLISPCLLSNPTLVAVTKPSQAQPGAGHDGVEGYSAALAVFVFSRISARSPPT